MATATSRPFATAFWHQELNRVVRFGVIETAEAERLGRADVEAPQYAVRLARWLVSEPCGGGGPGNPPSTRRPVGAVPRAGIGRAEGGLVDAPGRWLVVTKGE